MKDKYKDICIEQGWKIIGSPYVSLSITLKSGRWFCFILKDNETFSQRLVDSYAAFDVDQYIFWQVEQCRRDGKTFPSFKELLKDAEEIQDKMQKLMAAILVVDAEEKVELYRQIKEHLFEAHSMDGSGKILILAESYKEAAEKAEKFFDTTIAYTMVKPWPQETDIVKID